jgi:hypothetical protein
MNCCAARYEEEVAEPTVAGRDCLRARTRWPCSSTSSEGRPSTAAETAQSPMRRCLSLGLSVVAFGMGVVRLPMAARAGFASREATHFWSWIALLCQIHIGRCPNRWATVTKIHFGGGCQCE